MAKKTTRKTTENNIVDQTVTSSEVLPEICKIKHDIIDKEFNNIRNDANKKHEEIKEMISSFRDAVKDDLNKSHSNLKDKIVLTEKTIGDKIDSLSEFDDTLKGNGTPGVWESIRLLRWRVGINLTLMTIILILVLGGDFRGITFEKIKQRLGLNKTEVKQVEEVIEEEKIDTIVENKTEEVKKDESQVEEKKEEDAGE